jgi:hypothetical protein
MKKAYFVALATALLVLPGAGSHSVLAEQDSERTPNETTEVAPETAPLTPAQTIIFNTPHLKDITGPTTLNYRFERKSAFKDGFTDDVKVNIDRILEDGSKDVSFDFFSGDRNRPCSGTPGKWRDCSAATPTTSETRSVTGFWMPQR